MWESQVSGCQLAAWNCVKAQTNSLGGETACNLRILVHVLFIIAIDELVPNRLAEDQGHGQQKQRADGRSGVAVCGEGGSPIFVGRKSGPSPRRLGPSAGRVIFCGRLRLSGGFFFPFRLI